MWIDIDGNGTRFLNIDKLAMVVIYKDDNAIEVFDSLNEFSTNRRFFKGINANEIIKQLKCTYREGE